MFLAPVAFLGCSVIPHLPRASLDESFPKAFFGVSRSVAGTINLLKMLFPLESRNLLVM